MRARRIGITDTTLRDAHQSLWATRMRTAQMLPVLEQLDEVGFQLARMLGRGHLRRLPAVPGRRPLGAPAGHSQPRAPHAAADAAARPEPGRLPPLQRRHRAPLRGQGGRERHRHLPRVRRPERHAQLRDRGGGHQGVGQAFPGGGRVHDLARAFARPLHRGRPPARRDGRRLDLHQGHGGAALARTTPSSSSRASRASSPCRSSCTATTSAGLPR